MKNNMEKIDRRLSIAPMMEYTDRHERYFLRLISKHVLLYTEMVTTAAILHGKQSQLLSFNIEEHPLAIQLGGSDPGELAACAEISQKLGYDEVNLNVGCPSDRVTQGRIGACLMAEPRVVAECVKAMAQSVDIPVTVKSRIGIDDLDSYELLQAFVETVAAEGCNTFIIHARKAWLKGLSPRQNREIPPLKYETVYRIKQDYPSLEIVINGGITTLEQTEEHLKYVDGVMIGREAYHNPFILADADRRIFGDSDVAPPESMHQVLHKFMPYLEKQLSAGVPLTAISRHLLGLFHGRTGARGWRRYISENAHLQGAGSEVISHAASLVPLDG